MTKKPSPLAYATVRAMLREAVEELRDHSIKKVPAGKFIWDHSEAELDAAIDRASKLYGAEFWTFLHGVDAYIEKRRRRHERRTWPIR